MKKRKAQEEKKPICSECSKEQNNKRYDDVTLASTVNPHLEKVEGRRETGKKKQEGGGVLPPSPSSELATRQEVGTTQTTTEVTEAMYDPTEPGFGVTEPGVHGPRPQSYAAPWPGSLSPGTLERLARNHRQERFQWGVAVPQGKLRALPAHRLSSSNESSSSSSSNSNRNSSSRRRTMLRKGRRRGSSRRPRRGRGVLRVGRRRVSKPPGLE